MLRGFIYFIVVGFLTASCSSTRRMANANNTRESPEHSSSLPSKRVYKTGQPAASTELAGVMGTYPSLNVNGNIESSSWLQFKYAMLTDVPVEAMNNLSLLYFMEDWYGTPYKYGGSTKKGIDCSAFALGLMSTVFNITIPRTAQAQYDFTDRIELNELREGDLVFFNTRGGVSHVGVYLLNNKFVHASLSNGVMISDLLENYYVKRYIGAGRVKQNL